MSAKTVSASVAFVALGFSEGAKGYMMDTGNEEMQQEIKLFKHAQEIGKEMLAFQNREHFLVGLGEGDEGDVRKFCEKFKTEDYKKIGWPAKFVWTERLFFEMINKSQHTVAKMVIDECYLETLNLWTADQNKFGIKLKNLPKTIPKFLSDRVSGVEARHKFLKEFLDHDKKHEHSLTTDRDGSYNQFLEYIEVNEAYKKFLVDEDNKYGEFRKFYLLRYRDLIDSLDEEMIVALITKGDFNKASTGIDQLTHRSAVWARLTKEMDREKEIRLFAEANMELEKFYSRKDTPYHSSAYVQNLWNFNLEEFKAAVERKIFEIAVWIGLPKTSLSLETLHELFDTETNDKLLQVLLKRSQLLEKQEELETETESSSPIIY